MYSAVMPENAWTSTAFRALSCRSSSEASPGGCDTRVAIAALSWELNLGQGAAGGLRDSQARLETCNAACACAETAWRCGGIG